MNDVYIVAALRTPIGRFGGAFKNLGPAELAAPVMKAVLEEASVSGGALDLVLMGNVLRAGRGQLIARQAALKAGISPQVDAVSMDMVCSSGMMSVITAASYIRSGSAHLVLAGGTESMSSAGFFLSGKARWGYKYLPGPNEPILDILQRDGLSDPLSGESMGEQAERMVDEAKVTRSELDQVAKRSHHRAALAIKTGAFTGELVPLTVRGRAVDQDEGVRPNTTIAQLGKLRPVFSKTGSLTAGNSSQISDGAAALLLASEEAVQSHGLVPVAKFVAGAWASGEPWRFLEVPVAATKKALRLANREVSSIDIYENNEAFALSNLLYSGHLGISEEKLNVNGGAVALGHPIGCSGARILATLIGALKHRGLQTGLAAICHGLGGGTAVIVERA